MPGLRFDRSSFLRSSGLACVLGLSACVLEPSDEGADELGDGDVHGDGDSSDEATDTGGPCGPAEATPIEGCPDIVGEGFCSDHGSHVSTDTMIEWSNNPPHSGDHFPLWETNKGEHETPIERGYWVHNLEHGWIVLAYNCPEGCDAELEVLRSVIDARPDLSILMTEDPLLDGPRFAAISWTWVLEFDVPLLEVLLCFVDQHYDHAPESVL